MNGKELVREKFRGNIFLSVTAAQHTPPVRYLCLDWLMDLNPLSAGFCWRAGKLADFVTKVWTPLLLARALSDSLRQARALGLQNDPVVVAQLDAIAAETAELDKLAEQQLAGRPTPWWADGEYDVTRAEDANDVGASLESAFLVCWRNGHCPLQVWRS